MSALLLIGLVVGRQAVAPAAAQENPHPAQFSLSDTGRVADPYVSFRVREWTLNDGLPEPLTTVAQTPDGYLWITTFDGLVRFDGVRFTRYTTDNTPIFRSHDLIGLYVAQDGALWTGGRDGWVYRLREGTWTAYDLTDILPRHWVQGFAEDATGTLWMVSSGPITARFDGTTWQRTPQPIRDVWTPLVADADGTIWTLLDATAAPGRPETLIYGGVVARWDGQRFVPVPDDRWQGFVATQHGPLFHRVDNLAAARSGESRTRVTLTRADGTVRGWFWTDGSRAYARLVDSAGRVWVQRMKDGVLSVITVERDGVELARIAPEGGTWVEQVFEDRQGNVWVHSRSSGLIQVTEEPFRRFTTQEGAPRFALRAVQAPDGAMLVSSDWGVPGPNLSVIRDGVVTPQTFALPSVPPEVRSNMSDGGHVQLGQVTTDAQGQRWALVNRYLLRLRDEEATIAWSTRGSNLWALHTDPADPEALWLGDTAGGVYRYDLKRAAVTASLQATGRVHQIHRGPRGRLWVGTEDGLWVRAPDGTLVRRAEAAVANWPVRDLLNGPEGALWVATAGRGLVRLRDGALHALGTDEGLPTNHLSAVVLDDRGMFWLSGRQALYRLRYDDASAVLDGTRTRATVVELLPSAGHLGSSNKLMEVGQARDGSLWVPSFSGVTRIDPAFYARQYDEPLPVHIEALDTAQGSVLPLADSLQLPLDERTLTIQYTAPDLRAPQLVRFRTRLDGRDATWVDQGAARQVTYGGLPPGAYTFRVQAMNAGGTWHPTGATLAFTVPRRFTETGGFAGLCVLGLFGFGFLVYRIRVRALRKRQDELNALVAERTAQLQTEKEKVLAQADALRSLDNAKSRVFANISHEFRTPLTLTLGPLDDLKDGLYGSLPSPVIEQVALARRNASRVLDLVNQLLDVARLEAGQVRLEARPVDLGAFVAAAVQAFTPLAERNAVTLSLQRPAPDASADANVWANPEQLQTILSNLLSNALKFTPEGGSVRVVCSLTGEAACVAVRDSGPGIPAADLPHVFDRFYRAEAYSRHGQSGSGIGLALTKELVDLHHGTLTAESEEGFGSQFTLELPRGDAHLRPEEKVVDDLPTETVAQLPWELRLPAEGSTGDGAYNETRTPEENGTDAGDGRSPEASEDVTTILLVEDNAGVRAYVRRHLAKDYRLLEAADGRDGLAQAREALPDLILSDVMMPAMDGIELCRALKADPATDFIPVILLTARAEMEDRIGGLEEGADDYLTKPFEVAELQARIANLIRSRQRLRERFSDPPLTVQPTPVEVASTDQAFLDAVRTVIEANLANEDFSVDQLAEAVGFSRVHLYRRLQELIGEAPSALIRSMRVGRAAQLLAQQAGTVSEVAYGVGFKSVSHFSRVFRKHHGHPPSQHPVESTAT
jgi:signal transduction histidine kinase/DNA-binding response OmpR family regulator/ligand-binding sensor domain-containing protein